MENAERTPGSIASLLKKIFRVAAAIEEKIDARLLAIEKAKTV